MRIFLVVTFILVLTGCTFFDGKSDRDLVSSNEDASEVRTREVELEKLEEDFESFKRNRKNAGSTE